MNQAQTPIVVAGAGVVGVCIACELLRRGHAVTLLDAEAPGNGCSAGNAGIVAAESISPLASPRVLAKLPSMLLRRHAPLRLRPAYSVRFLPWMWRFLRAARAAHQHRSTQALAALQGDTVAAWQALLQWAGCSPLLQSGGWLFAYSTTAGFDADRGERALQQQHGIDWQPLNAAQIEDLAPGLSSAVRHCVHYPDSAWCADPQGLVGQLAASFTARGGRLLQARIRSLQAHPAGQRIETSAGTLECARLVLCLGAYSARFATDLEGFPIPLEAERGYHLQFAPADPGLRIPVMFSEHKIVATPMAMGLRLAGTAEFAGLDHPPDYRRATMMAHVLQPLLRQMPDTPTTSWMGRRPTLPDSLPVISGSTRHPGLYYAFGHQHLGLTLAAVGATALADLLEGRKDRTSLAEFAIDRFARG